MDGADYLWDISFESGKFDDYSSSMIVLDKRKSIPCISLGVQHHNRRTNEW